ncbi:cellular communication network factor protein Ccn [Lycorma delicatula]|uniref:cellular communication network factor protein Ccn n=1 Tax=Lycorma delicatula TaxID=130591 RepID=UPI003F516CDB
MEVPVLIWSALIICLAGVFKGVSTICSTCENEELKIAPVPQGCEYPCRCESGPPSCREGVGTVRDHCGCCEICARQHGEPCSTWEMCDESKGLVCHYASQFAKTGYCTEPKGLPCAVHNASYSHGETFLLDCRTQCTCQDGRYACSSLCPQESISPKGSCRHPRLVDVPGHCCRQWVCDRQPVPECRPETTPWTRCSEECGLGVSHRLSSNNPQCVPRNESRLCQLRPCTPTGVHTWHGRRHHVRKGHECKATERTARKQHLEVGGCRSRRRFRPRYCGRCRGPCQPDLSHTLRVELLCPQYNVSDDPSLTGNPTWTTDSPSSTSHSHSVFVNIEWIIKCHCVKPELLHRVHRTADP